MPYRRVAGNPVTARTLGWVAAGSVLIGVGAAGMIRASIGVTPWDVLTTAVSERSGLTVGTTGALLTVVVLALCAPFGRLPGWGNVVIMVCIGGAIDLCLALMDEPGSLGARLALYAVGVPIVCFGVGLIVLADIGVGPLEMVMLVATDRSVPLVWARVAIEGTALAAGWLLGGAMGLGTALFAVAAGPLIALSLRVQRPLAPTTSA